MTFNINSIAVIGAGPAGLVSLNEFLHTAKDGSSTIHEGKLPDEPAFTKVVSFEQKDDVGGVWKTSVDHADEIPEELFHKQYHKPEVIQPKIEPPAQLTDDTTVDSPIVTDKAADDELQWKRSGVYPGLYTNVPRRFLRFSTIPYEEPENKNTVIDPLITYQEVTQVLQNFAKKNDLKKHIRFNTQVESVSKKDGKWVLTLRHTNRETGKDEWYRETFDAVVVASGHYSVPYVPYVEGIETRPPGSTIHSKTFRNADEYKDKNVIIVGSSLSGVDIVQYVYPVAKKLIISRSPGKEEIYPWITKAAKSFENKPHITKFEGKKVYFEDGTVLDDVDKVIFATGYHWNYPYLASKFLQLTTGGSPNSKPTSGSRVKGLYYDTFNIEDPTLGFVGISLTSVKFHTLETSAIALAGVWSNASELPSKEVQYQWEQDRLKETADNYVFHFYHFSVTKEQWVDKILKYGTKNRKNPLEGEVITETYNKALDAAERVFFDLKDQKVPYEETLYKN